MILTVDAGNTRIKYAVVDAGGVVPLGSHSTRENVRASCARILAANPGRAASLEGVAMASVVPSVSRSLASALRGSTGLRPLVIDHRLRLPFVLAVARPDRVGVDRLCAAAGASIPRRRGVIVIDVGSAITVDLVERRRYRGGVILAGPALALEALGAYAEQLPDIDYARVREPFPALFTGTETSMILGASRGAVGAVREAVRVLQARAGTALPKVLTGGAAASLSAGFPASWRREPHLVHAGIFRIWSMNR